MTLHLFSRESALTILAQGGIEPQAAVRFLGDTVSAPHQCGRFESLCQSLGRQSFPDPLVIAVALEPDIVHKVEMHFIQVELARQHTW
jgi:hypothetical protein